MDSPRWTLVKSEFARVQALPADERSAALAALDGALRDEVASLLDALAHVPSALEGERIGPLARADDEAPRERVGAWQITATLGRGGMGVVYLGHRQADDIDLQAAVKVVAGATHSGAIARRFRAERRILADLDHPGIARLLDGGTTEDGLPYFALEYVDGAPIGDYVTAHALDLRARLALFRRVCDAVAYAHGHLVVHRDLKPANILVTADGSPKLLDFGIAKVLSAEGDEGVEPATVTVQGWMTPAYASPEQMRGLPTTIASDVYALGLILYELLVEAPAIRRDSAPVDVARVKLEGDIPRPSTAVLRAADEPTRGRADRARLARALRGDLDTIVLKAIAVEPSRRYVSVSALADEIDRYLAGRPVLARADSVSYRAAKFVGRHRWAVAASVVAVVALTTTAAVALRQARLASARFEQVHGLAKSMMFELHDIVAPLPGSLEARRLIVDRSLAYLDRLSRDEGAGQDVQLDVVRGYLRLSSILGRALDSAGLGRSGEALERTRQAVDVARRTVRANPRSTEARMMLVEALQAATEAYDLRGDSAAAAAAGEEAIAVAAALVREHPAEARYKARLADATVKTANAFFYGPSQERGLALFKQAVALEQELHKADPDRPERQLGLSAASHFLGSALIEAGNLPPAETHLREALRLDELRAVAAPETAKGDVADDLLQLSQLMVRMRRFDEAADYLTRAVAVRREISAAQPQSQLAQMRVGAALDRLAWLMVSRGTPALAIEPGSEAVAIGARVWGADRANRTAAREYLYAMTDLSVALLRVKRVSEGCALADKAGAFGAAEGARLGPPGPSLLKRVDGVLKECGRHASTTP
jgi:non-specific serine/threonine protein kinase/serine/threonine-protein kinase